MNADVTHGGSHNSGLHASSHNSGSSALLELPRHGIQLVSSYLHGFQRMFSLPGSYGKLEADSTDPAALLLMPLTIVLFGATGDLARKKLFPAIYQLCVLALLGHSVLWGRAVVEDTLSAICQAQTFESLTESLACADGKISRSLLHNPF